MAFYLFPMLMYRRAKRISSASFPLPNFPFSQSFEQSRKIYQIATQQYLGLGGLLQYIPGTRANKARQKFINELELDLTARKEKLNKSKGQLIGQQLLAQGRELEGKLEDKKKSRVDFFRAKLMINLAELSLSSLVHRGPVSQLKSINIFFFSKISGNYKVTTEEILSNFPVLPRIATLLSKTLANISTKDPNIKMRPWKFITHFFNKLNYHVLGESFVADIENSLTNPLAIINSTVITLFFCCAKIADFIPTASILKRPILGFLALCTAVIILPLSIATCLWRLLPEKILTVAIQPLYHCTETLYETCASLVTKKEVLLLTAQEFRDIRDLRREAKGSHSSYLAVQTTMDHSQYINTTKEALYIRKKQQSDQLIAVRSKKEKISQQLQLLSIFNAGKTREDAVEQAKVVLGIKPTC